MVIRVGCIRPKLTLSEGNCIQTLESLNIFSEDGCEVYTDTNRIFPIPFKVMDVSLDKQSLKNDSAVSKTGYLYKGEPKFFLYKCFCFFLK